MLQRPELLTPPHPGQDDKTADGEIRGSSHGARPGGEEPTLEKYEERAARWPLTLGASRVGQLARAQRRVCHLQGLAERAKPRRRDAPARCARAQVGEAGGRPLLPRPQRVRPRVRAGLRTHASRDRLRRMTYAAGTPRACMCMCVCVCVPVSYLSKVCLCLRWSLSESLSEVSLGLLP